MLHDYHVHSGVGCYVKNGSYSSPTLEWKLTVLLEYLTISTNIRCYEVCHWWPSATQCTDDYCIQHSL